MRVFVTGHKGMVGSACVQILSRQCEVITKNRHECWLTDWRSVSALCRSYSVDAIVHCAAAVGGIEFNAKNNYFMYTQNAELATGVIKGAIAANVQRLLYMGSSCIYPRECQQPIQPGSLLSGPLEPTNEGYALAKIQGVKLCEWASREFNFNYASIMPCNLYGPGDRYDSGRSHVIPALIHKMHKSKHTRKPVELLGTGSALREFLYVDDLARAVAALLPSKRSGVFNVGSGIELFIAELARKIADSVGYEGELCFNGDQFMDGTPRKLLAENRYLKESGWKPEVSLDNGLKAAYQDYKERQLWQSH